MLHQVQTWCANCALMRNCWLHVSAIDYGKFILMNFRVQIWQIHQPTIIWNFSWCAMAQPNPKVTQLVFTMHCDHPLKNCITICTCFSFSSYFSVGFFLWLFFLTFSNSPLAFSTNYGKTKRKSQTISKLLLRTQSTVTTLLLRIFQSDRFSFHLHQTWVTVNFK